MTDYNDPGKAGTITVCRAFYEQYGKEMIRREFPEYEHRIAVGLVGEGSECFGFDDEISRDHDFGLGFCMWLCREDFEKIGGRLQEAYLKLVQDKGQAFSEQAWGQFCSLENRHIEGRRGVSEIWQFYSGILRLTNDPDLLVGKQYWIYAEPRFLSTAVNGQVFRDDPGVFTSFRKTLEAFYPEKIFLYRLAEQLHLFSHGGQSNYPRMMARGDLVAARLCIDQTLRSAMEIAFLLARKYPPYYKWMFRALRELKILPELPGLLEKLAVLPPQTGVWQGISYNPTSVFCQDPVISCIEEIAGLLVKEMNRQGFIEGNERFLESHVRELTERAERS